MFKSHMYYKIIRLRVKEKDRDFNLYFQVEIYKQMPETSWLVLWDKNKKLNSW
jgi:hypothetical protein